jgi:hypothetical protein
VAKKETKWTVSKKDKSTAQTQETGVAEDRMLKWFAYAHLSDDLRAVSKPFHEAAHGLVLTLHPGPERTTALRKLLEAKDAAVRAAVVPGG